MSGPVNVLITGANTGIGRSTAIALAREGGRLWLAGRSEEKTAPVVEALNREHPASRATFLPLDLADLASVRACAARFLEEDEPLSVLLCNAGVGGSRGTTRDGFERTFGTNHLGHFLLTALLVPALRRAAATRRARVVVVASRAHRRAEGIDWASLREPTRSRTGIPEYAVSKLCNVLFARELARRVASERISTYALHPGVVASDMWRKLPWPIRPLAKLGMISNDEGAKTSTYCALAPEVEEETGLYWDDCRPREPSRLALDDALAKRLWETSEELTGQRWPSAPA